MASRREGMTVEELLRAGDGSDGPPALPRDDDGGDDGGDESPLERIATALEEISERLALLVEHEAELADEEDDALEIVAALEEWADDQELSRAQLARKLQVSTATIGNWFAGRSLPGEESLERILRLLREVE